MRTRRFFFKEGFFFFVLFFFSKTSGTIVVTSDKLAPRFGSADSTVVTSVHSCRGDVSLCQLLHSSDVTVAGQPAEQNRIPLCSEEDPVCLTDI